MTSHINTICEVLNSNFLHQEFQIQDIFNNLDGNIPLTSIQTAIHYSRHEGFITVDRPGRAGRIKKTYKLIDAINPERIKFSINMAVTKSKGLIDPDRFTDTNHPSKMHITDHFYSTFSVLSPQTQSILALCGPNTDRFIRNALKITDIKTGNISLVECDPETVETITWELGQLQKKIQLPKITMYNERLEDLSDSGFYQFQELDCYGNWKLLHETFNNRLIEQSKDTELMKGMIVTTFARREGISILNEYLAGLLSNIGTKFRGNVIMDKEVVKPMTGDWRYVHMYDTFPHFIDNGRLAKLIVYRYAQRGCGMFTAMFAYI